MKKPFADSHRVGVRQTRLQVLCLCSALLIGLISAIEIDTALADVSSLQPDTLALINNFIATLSPPTLRKQLIEAEIPAIGCPLDGQAGPQDTPTLPKTMRVLVPEGAASGLTYYSAFEGAGSGLVAPKGWDCFGTYGSAGSHLYITPNRLNTPILERPDKVGGGPVIIDNHLIGGTSGRFPIAQLSARIFPLARAFVQRVRAMGLDDPKTYVFKPWPADRLNRLSDFVVSYVTPSNTDGVGTIFGPTPGPELISGLVFLRSLSPGDGSVLERLAVRLPPSDARSYSAIALSSIARLDEPHSADAAEEIDKGASGEELTKKVHADCTQLWEFPETIAACMLEKEHEYGIVLAERYQQALKLSPNGSAAIRDSQRSWLKFQDSNCKLYGVRAMGQRPATARVSLAMCLLLSTIERAKELKQMTDQR